LPAAATAYSREIKSALSRWIAAWPTPYVPGDFADAETGPEVGAYALLEERASGRRGGIDAP
jgi:hypothetical protein